MNRSPLRAFLVIPPVLACFALSPHARATCQEGCLTNQNTVLGDDALLNNTGSYNTAIGFNALFSNTTGFSNTASGNNALYNNTTGISNTAQGVNALISNIVGSSNTATGDQALYDNTTGNDNTGVGASALLLNENGSDNTAVGVGALNQIRHGNNNIGLGAFAGRRCSGYNNIIIGNDGRNGESGAIRIGTTGTQTNAYVAGISGVTVAQGVGVIVDSSGHLGTVVSSARLKEGIKPMDRASEAILALKPVTFRYKHELEPRGHPAVWPSG